MDEFSRAVKSLAYTNSSENPIVSILGGLICGQVCNASIVHRIAIARMKGYLFNSEDHATAKDGYKNTRRRVTSCASFGAFARCLAREYVQMASEPGESNPNLCHVLCNRNTVHSEGRHRHFRAGENNNMKHIYTPDVVEKYNRREDSASRLNGSEEHKAIKGKASYCSLCSFTHSIMYRRKRFQKKGVSSTSQMI